MTPAIPAPRRYARMTVSPKSNHPLTRLPWCRNLVDEHHHGILMFRVRKLAVCTVGEPCIVWDFANARDVGAQI